MEWKGGGSQPKVPDTSTECLTQARRGKCTIENGLEEGQKAEIEPSPVDEN